MCAPRAVSSPHRISWTDGSEKKENCVFRRIANANVLPHLTSADTKMEYICYLLGVLFNRLFQPEAQTSLVFDKDNISNKRVDSCGVLLAQQVRNALCPWFRVGEIMHVPYARFCILGASERRAQFPERNAAKSMTCKSQMANAVRELETNPAKSMALIQAAVAWGQFIPFEIEPMPGFRVLRHIR